MPAVVSLEELREMFTGVPGETGGWATTPSYNRLLALEIAKHTHPDKLDTLIRWLYDTTPTEDIPPAALEEIRVGFQQYQYLQRIMERAREDGD